jgi:hypothetical protein
MPPPPPVTATTLPARNPAIVNLLIMSGTRVDRAAEAQLP